MKRSQAVSGYQIARQSIALALSAFLIPFASGNLYAQGGYAPLDAPGLDQLVAPIALYPDSLVAQILTAATFPEQVREADDWTRQNAGLRPQQRADLANGMPWDPSVKALTAFPTVLNSLARNPNWTASLGNAYYNQPGDVMNAVQAMRVQAQQGGYLRSTPQQRVYYDGGQILIAPVNPELVYVPYYDPWRIYGAGIFAPYPGYYLAPGPPGWAVGLGIGFAVGISVGLFAHYGWGYNSWAPNWRGGGVYYNHADYISRSTTVYNHGNFGGYNRGVFEHAGRGVPSNFHPGVTRETATFGRGQNVNRPGPAARAEGARPQASRAAPAGRATAGRPQAQSAQARAGNTGRPQTASRPTAHSAPAGGNRPQAHSAPAGRAAPAAHSAPAGGNRPQAHAASAGGNRPQPHAAPAGHGGGEHHK